MGRVDMEDVVMVVQEMDMVMEEMFMEKKWLEEVMNQQRMYVKSLFFLTYILAHKMIIYRLY